jgi:hypothetical protein
MLGGTALTLVGTALALAAMVLAMALASSCGLITFFF